jgi:hypothetical protein
VVGTGRDPFSEFLFDTYCIVLYLQSPQSCMINGGTLLVFKSLSGQALFSSYLFWQKQSTNSERGSIMPCAVKSGFKTGLQISKINHVDSYTTKKG